MHEVLSPSLCQSLRLAFLSALFISKLSSDRVAVLCLNLAGLPKATERVSLFHKADWPVVSHVSTPRAYQTLKIWEN